MIKTLFAACLTVLIALTSAQGESPEEWVKLGARVHGGFGAFIPVGIRIGEDAMKRLNAQPRELSVVYYSGEGVPCPCSVDGDARAKRKPRARFCPRCGGEVATRHVRGGCHPATQGRRGVEIHGADVPHGQTRRDQPHHSGSARAYKAVMGIGDLFVVEPVAK